MNEERIATGPGPELPWWDAPFRSLVGGRRIIVAAGTVFTGARAARALREFGAVDVMVYSLSTGSEPDDVRVFSVGETMSTEPGSMTRQAHRHTHEPSDAAQRAFDEFDPDRTALVFRMLAAEPSHLAGRRVVAWRPPEWVALEDKTVIDGFWARHGVRHKRSVVVSLDDAPRCATDVDEGAGTVWAADAREGINGGGELTRRVRGADDAELVRSDLAPHCDTVRIMPYIEGIPCSVHGIVMPDGVAVLRPVEMVVLRNETQFVYLGASTFWDPPRRVRDQMRDLARTVGRALAEEVGFRGAFTLDGVVDDDGFWPTELNPRVGGGLQAITDAAAAPPVLLFELVVAGVDLGLGAAELERRLLTIADEHRSARLLLLAHPDVPGERTVRLRDGGWSWCNSHDDDAFADLSVLDLGIISALRPGAVATGHSVAATVASLAEFLDRELGTSFGTLQPPSAG